MEQALKLEVMQLVVVEVVVEQERVPFVLVEF